MKRLFRLCLAGLLLAAGASGARADGCIYFGVRDATALIERPHNQANLHPQGGWTLYPGQAGSGVPSCSPYSAVYGLVPPHVSAFRVTEKLHQLGIHPKPPQPLYLGRNPAVADNVDLPTPKTWLPKEEEEKKENNNNRPPAPAPRPKMKDKDPTDNEKLGKPKVEG